jgi:hypothetical protein
LNGKVVCGRALVVHFAEEKVHYKSDAPVEELVKTALSSGGVSSDAKQSEGSALITSSSAAIVTALKAKLQQMEREKD